MQGDLDKILKFQIEMILMKIIKIIKFVQILPEIKYEEAKFGFI